MTGLVREPLRLNSQVVLKNLMLRSLSWVITAGNSAE
jgi:hypothetical protein